jgi:DNA polymerase V
MASYPSPAEGIEEEPLDLHTHVVKNPTATFFFYAQGDHLRDDLIFDGSLLIVDRSVKPTYGRIVVAEEDGCFVVCRFRNDVPIVVGVVTAALTWL